MKKLRQAGIFGALGFLFGTLAQIAIWKTDVGTQWIYNNGGLLVFALTPIYAILSSALMTGYFGFKDKFVGKDDQGNRVFSAFWAVALLMQVMGILVAIEAVLEA
jgi:cytochrome b